jgi:aspartokinase/homoserine dehydrogenase 1
MLFGLILSHLDPSAMVPCIDDSIPVYVRNIFNPSFEGTVVQGRSPSLAEKAEEGSVKNWRAKKGEIPIKGITSVDSVALVTLEGASTIGGSNVAEKFMGAMADNDVNVLIITQASSESSICIAVPENEGEKAIIALQSAFELELARSTVGSISLNKGLSIVAIVGEGMAYSSGISSTLMGSLSKANVNIRLIAQGSSERQIAVVVDKDDTTRALRAAHQAFTLSDTTVSITLLGSTGSIGSTFVNALQKQRRTLIDKLGVCPRVMISANSKKMAIAQNARGLSVDNIVTDLSEEKDVVDLDLDRITAELEADVNPHRVVIDMTNSDVVAEYYERWMSAGVDLISPSRKVMAGPLDKYNRAVDVQKGNFVNWQYESSVGSALPVLTTLRDLIETGDEVHKIRGSVSGTFAYVLSILSEETSFSDALGAAMEKGFTEKDIREDLTGLDVARKIVILARQIGMDIELEDVEVESFLPEELASKANITLEDVKSLDAGMLEKFQAAKAKDQVLRYKFEIEKDTGKCRCFLTSVDKQDPLFRLKNVENLVAFETDRYTASPLIVKGAAAGPELAAAGIFSDLLRCTRAYSSERS